MELSRSWGERLWLGGVHMQSARASFGYLLLGRCFGVSLLHDAVNVMYDLLSAYLAADLALKANVLVCAGVKAFDTPVFQFALTNLSEK